MPTDPSSVAAKIEVSVWFLLSVRKSVVELEFPPLHKSVCSLIPTNGTFSWQFTHKRYAFLAIFVLDNCHVQVTLDWSNINEGTARDNFFQLF